MTRKKIDSAKIFLQDNLALFRCPVCFERFQPVSSVDYSIRCYGGHQFDLSKKGSLHFINNSPGDQYGKNQLSARYRIAQLGFWDPLVKRIYQNIRNHSGPVVDIRCGEGSHLSDKVYSNHKVVDNFKKEFTRVEIEDVIYSVELNQEDLKMYWL